MLVDYVLDNYTNEKARAIFNAIDLINEYGLLDIEDELDEILILIETNDTFTTSSNIVSTVMKYLLNILNEHFIKVDETVDDLELITNMAKTLRVAAEEYEPTYLLERINFTLEEDNQAIDVYAKLVELLTDTREEDVLTTIYSIEEDIINNLKVILDEKTINVDLLTNFTNNDTVERYKAYLKGRRTGIVYELVKGGLVPGNYDFNTLYLYVEEALPNLSREDIIFETLSLIMVSDTDVEDIEETIVKLSKLLGATDIEAKVYLTELKSEYYG